MATASLTGLFKELRGKLGKEFIVKQYKGKTVITAYPAKKKKKKKPTPLQSLYREDFIAGVKYAQAIIGDPVKKKAYAKKTAPGQTVYNYAISEYSRKYGVKSGRRVLDPDK
jgi:hypothetical protein